MEKSFEFLLTNLAILIIELPVLFLIGKFVLKNRIGSDLIIFSGAIATFMSTPYLQYICPLFFDINSSYYLYLSQATVIVIEAIVLCNALRISINKAIIISCIVNVLSYLFFGKVMQLILGGV